VGVDAAGPPREAGEPTVREAALRGRNVGLRRILANRSGDSKEKPAFRWDTAKRARKRRSDEEEGERSADVSGYVAQVARL